MRRVEVLGLVACLSTHIAFADSTKTTPAERPAICDPTQWSVVKSATANFGKTLPNATVLLLRSIPVTGEDGVGRELHTANMIVTANEQLVYAFASLTVPPFDNRRWDTVYDIDDFDGADALLELRDVTGDHVPEIIFHTGWRPASDHDNVVHVLQYTGAQPTYFRDIRADRFTESWWFNFGWFDIDGRTMAVVAEPVDPPVPEGEIVCHACPKFHKYLVYGWNASSGQFELRQTIPPTEKLHDGEDNPLKIDRSYIVAAVKEHRQ